MNAFIINLTAKKACCAVPKRIENLRERILQCAKAELLEKGYDALTIRSVARSCGIAVGTVYNYFSSKEMLAALVMLEDWMLLLGRMRSGCEAAKSLPDALTTMNEGVCSFYGVYRNVWAGYSFTDTERTAFSDRHRMLVRQLAECVAPVLTRMGVDPADGMDVFLAENVLICAGDSELRFDTLLRIVKRILP